MPKNEFRHESLQDNRTILTYLKAIEEGFASGRLTLSDEDEEIVLRPEGLVRFEIGATRKRGRIRMTVRFDWKEELQENAEKGSLKINGEGE